jgi:hypothetical protein
MRYPGLKRPLLLAGLLSVGIFALPGFPISGRAAADEPFPGPRIGRPYDQAPGVLEAPGVLAAAQPKTPPMGAKAPPKIGAESVPKDSPYTPQTIQEVEIDIAVKPADSKVDLPPMIHYSPAEIAKRDPVHFAPQPVILTRLDGLHIDQRLSGPVAPFCFLPTYFEDESLTRFGYSHGHHIQPVLSAAQFYASVPLLPYLMRKRHPWDPVCPNYIPPPLTLRGKLKKIGRGITLDAVAVEAACIATTYLVVP